MTARNLEDMMATGAGGGVGAFLEDASRRWAALPPESMLNASELAEALLGTMSTVLHEQRDACYVSTPITTGSEFVDWWRRQGHSLGRDDPAYEVELQHVVRRNTEAVRPLVAKVERIFQHPVIDPTRLGPVPGWQQPDYHRFWVRVIDRFVQTVVLADGWSYSSGCALEFAAAVTRDRVVLDAALRPLSRQRGACLLEDAARELDAAGLSAAAQREALEQLAGTTSMGTPDPTRSREAS
jgi:hypothetical protein